MAQQEQPLSTGGLGFFSSPSLILDGPNQGKVIKRYRGLRNRKATEQVLEWHNAYVKQLTQAGIELPATEAYVEEEGRRHYIVILQRHFPESELVRSLMVEGDVATCITHMQGIMRDAIRLINWKGRNPNEPIGFHPTLRNYAVQNGTYIYFDTFPPMGGISQQQVNRMIVDFAPVRVPAFLRRMLQPFMGYVSNEYYDATKMLAGIVGSTCRLHPEHTSDFLTAAMEPLSELEDPMQRQLVAGQLEKPPRLGGTWVTVRKMLGLQGKPNIAPE